MQHAADSATIADGRDPVVALADRRSSVERESPSSASPLPTALQRRLAAKRLTLSPPLNMVRRCPIVGSARRARAKMRE